MDKLVSVAVGRFSTDILGISMVDRSKVQGNCRFNS